MAWTLADFDTASVASGNLTLPTLTLDAAGDLYVAFITIRGTAAFTLPAGWTQIVQNNSGNTSTTPNASIAGGLLAYIVRGSSAPSLTFTRTGGDAATGWVAAFRHSGGLPARFDVAGSTFLAANNTVVTVSSLTAAADDSLVVTGGFIPDNAIDQNDITATDPSSWSSNGASTTQGADAAVYFSYADKATAGATGTITATMSATSRHGLAAAIFRPFRGVVADAGSYTITGQPVTDPTIRLVADAGSYAVTGVAANLLYNRLVAANAGSYAVTGVAVNFIFDHKIFADAGSYSILGSDSTLAKNIIMAADGGLYSYFGNDAQLAVIPRWTWTEDDLLNNSWIEGLNLSNSWVETSPQTNTWIEDDTG